MIALLRRRAMMMLAAMEGDADMNIKTGEFAGDGSASVTIEHGLGEVPLLFAFIGDEVGEETVGTFSGMWMNTGVATRFTSAVSKQWSEAGTYMMNDGTNVLANAAPYSASYGVYTVDEEQITIYQYASKQVFISGKTYKWIAIADWR